MSSTNPSSSIPVSQFQFQFQFPPGNEYEFKFVAEGAANLVFEVLVPPKDDNSSGIFNGNLLRVPKAGTKAHPHKELQVYWETVVKPLFNPEDLVQHQLIRLGGNEVVSRLNAVLAQEDATRRVDFRGTRVDEAEYGMLIEDMRQRRLDDLALEFKPKWLAQSPNAPSSATRCRNCAREALKQHTKASPPSHQPPHRTILCPLNLLTCATSPPALANILAHFGSLSPSISPETAPPAQYTRLVTWLQTNALLPRLRAAQLANDVAGPLGVDAHDDPAALQLAMTLRDCTCFVRIPGDPGLPVEAKLADLDKKNAAAKLEYWQTMERRLVEGGYYEGREGERVETDCLLEREAKGVDGVVEG